MIIADPIYKVIEIPDEFKIIIDHQYFQRLRRIKQLGTASLVYPSANHTRFEHSLGVGYLAKIVAKKLKLDSNKYLLLGLLHDIGHGPFSHLSEKALGIDHEKVTIERIKEMKNEISELGYDYKEIIKSFENDIGIIKGSLDVDRMDYLQRDAYFTGNYVGIQNVFYIINNFLIFDDKLVIKEKAVPSVESFLMARLIMYKTVYLHKTTVAANLLIERAIKDLLEIYNPKEIFKMDDYSLICNLRKLNSKYYMKFENRILPKLIFSKNISDEKLINHIQKELEGYNAYIWFNKQKTPEYSIKVITKNNGIFEISELSLIVKELKKYEKEMDNFRIYLDREHLNEKEEILRILNNYF